MSRAGDAAAAGATQGNGGGGKKNVRVLRLYNTNASASLPGGGRREGAARAGRENEASLVSRASIQWVTTVTGWVKVGS